MTALGPSAPFPPSLTSIFSSKRKPSGKYPSRPLTHLCVYSEIVFYLNKEFANHLDSLDVIEKEDLNLVNHLSGKTQKYLKLSFRNMTELIKVRADLKPIVTKNKREKDQQEAYDGWYD